jgi:hypothetical protein
MRICVPKRSGRELALWADQLHPGGRDQALVLQIVRVIVRELGKKRPYAIRKREDSFVDSLGCCWLLSSFAVVR